jgi:tRNA-binding protein
MAPPAKKPDVTAEDFFRIDIRAGQVVTVEEFPAARTPAYILSVDFGPEVGTLKTSAQITNYPEEDLLGRLVVGAVNLGTKRIAGLRSEFLILGAIDDDGTVRLLGLEEGVEPGQPIA